MGVSVLLVLLATVNSIGYQNRTNEYQKCFDAEINDTVVSLERWGKTGNKVRLTNGESFGIFIAPLTKVIELENVIQKKKNIVILQKKPKTILLFSWTHTTTNGLLKLLIHH